MGVGDKKGGTSAIHEGVERRNLRDRSETSRKKKATTNTSKGRQQ
jgi:hypothetical protein